MVTVSETNASITLDPNQIRNNFKADASINIIDTLVVDAPYCQDLYKNLDLKQSLETINNKSESSIES